MRTTLVLFILFEILLAIGIPVLLVCALIKFLFGA